MLIKNKHLFLQSRKSFYIFANLKKNVKKNITY